MSYLSFFQELAAADNGTLVTAHLKNNTKVTGILKAVDQNMNLEFSDLQVSELPLEM